MSGGEWEMRKKVMEALGGARAYGKVFLKMTALSALMGVACGGLGGVFHHAVEVSGYLFREHGWLLYLLPLAGLASSGSTAPPASARTGAPIW